MAQTGTPSALAVAGMLTVLSVSAAGQYVSTHPVGVGLGYHTYGFTNTPVALNRDRAVVVTEGGDLGVGAADDGLLVALGLEDGEYWFQYMPFAPLLSDYEVLVRRVFRLSDSSVLYLADGTEAAGNGRIMVLKGLDNGSPHYVLHSGLAADIWPRGWGTPASLDDTTVALPSPGSDGIAGTTDDALLVCTGVGTPAFTMHVYQPGCGLGTAIKGISSDTAVATGMGNDGLLGTPDDLLVVAHRDGGQVQFATHALGYALGVWLDSRVPLTVGQGALLYPTTTGPAGGQTVSQTFTLVRGLPAAPQGVPVTSHTSGSLGGWGAPRPVYLGQHRLAHQDAGPDRVAGTADDTIVLITGLDETPQVTHLAAGIGLGMPLWPRQLLDLGDVKVTGTNGPDGAFNTPDDGLAVVAGIEEMNLTITTIPLGGAVSNIGGMGGDSVWAHVMGVGHLFVGAVTGLQPYSTSLGISMPAPGVPLVVNPWTLLFTRGGQTMGTQLNDEVVMVHFPYVESLGKGTEGAGGLRPRLVTDRNPVLGTGTYAVRLEDALPGAPCAVGFSHSPAWWQLSKSSVLYLDPYRIIGWLEGTVDPMGRYNWYTDLPPDPALAGRSYAGQAAVLDPTHPDRFTLTNGLVFHL